MTPRGFVSAGPRTHVPSDFRSDIPVEIGAYTSIASGVSVVSGQHPLVTHPGAVSNFPFREHGFGDYPPSFSGGEVEIGNDVWIGQGAVLLEDVVVADGACVAAHAVVVKDVRPYTLVAGNPAIEKKELHPVPGTVEALLRIRWWDWPEAKIREALPYMHSALEFVAKFG